VSGIGDCLELFLEKDAAGAVEQFFSDKSADDDYKTPKSWGTVVLQK
jgi:hypothetical protein